MNVITKEGSVPVKAWTDFVEFEDEAKAQVANLAALPFIHKHVAVMPDVHWGIGATVGSVIATKHAIIPAAVGVDIGCGMVAQKLSIKGEQLSDDLGILRFLIERAVPVGTPGRGKRSDEGSWHDVPQNCVRAYLETCGEFPADIATRHPKLKIDAAAPPSQIGTLGGGNHFIEVCLDEDEYVWIVLHSGSRGVGNKIGHHFIEVARQDMRQWFINLPDQDLAYLPEGTQHFSDYVAAVSWAQEYAHVNRQVMLGNIVAALADKVEFTLAEDAISCHHNYVQMEHHFGTNVLVTRKGAVRARVGDLGVIPGSMGARSYIVRGKGNADSFESCSHGAGRRMSRKKARDMYTVADHEAATAGIECRKDAGVLDETPMAYKNIDDVMASQQDLVDVVHTLHQIICVKG